jgi:hypothetical protein
MSAVPCALYYNCSSRFSKPRVQYFERDLSFAEVLGLRNFRPEQSTFPPLGPSCDMHDARCGNVTIASTSGRTKWIEISLEKNELANESSGVPLTTQQVKVKLRFTQLVAN